MKIIFNQDWASELSVWSNTTYVPNLKASEMRMAHQLKKSNLKINVYLNNEQKIIANLNSLRRRDLEDWQTNKAIITTAISPYDFNDISAITVNKINISGNFLCLHTHLELKNGAKIRCGFILSETLNLYGNFYAQYISCENPEPELNIPNKEAPISRNPEHIKIANAVYPSDNCTSESTLVEKVNDVNTDTDSNASSDADPLSVDSDDEQLNIFSKNKKDTPTPTSSAVEYDDNNEVDEILTSYRQFKVQSTEEDDAKNTQPIEKDKSSLSSLFNNPQHWRSSFFHPHENKESKSFFSSLITQRPENPAPDETYISVNLNIL